MTLVLASRRTGGPDPDIDPGEDYPGVAATAEGTKQRGSLAAALSDEGARPPVTAVSGPSRRPAEETLRHRAVLERDCTAR
ncbi:hypothetical protein GCM10010109_64410 [Actinoplanes campanulatus]|nr:hypothetical protein GCM10010109_64410 [Actinoplanes campanulatus]GID39713.1 hypothetical protein Aca09nite_62190 [Actinoplanes campanulatus]